MKKYTIVLFIAMQTFAACKNTNENPVQERGAAITPVMSDPAPAYFSDNVENSYVSFDLSLPEGVTIEKASIEVSYKDASAVLKEISIPVKDLKITATEVIRALNVSAYDLGDVFYLYVLTTKNGKTTRSTAAFSIPVVCYFDPSMLVGAFHAESSDWGVSGSVTMEADPDNPYKIYINGYPEAEGITGNGNRIELNVNPNNFNVKGPKVTIAADLSEWDYPYHDYAYEPVSGSYSACDDKYSVTFAISVSEGNFGNFAFVFTRAQ